MNIAEITAENTMGQILHAFPGARRALMRKYHIGGCGNCGFEDNETLGEVIKRHNVLSASEVIEYLRTAEEHEATLKVSATEVHRLCQSDSPPKLIDVRTPEEQKICCIEGALPASQQLVQEMMASWPKDTPIIAYCHQGLRSLDAASYLIGHGFTNVKSMTGGIHAWTNEVDQEMPTY